MKEDRRKADLGFLFFPPSGEAYQSRSEESVKENIIQMGMVVYACNPSIQEVTARVQGHCRLNSEFKGSRRCVKPCCKQEGENCSMILLVCFGGGGRLSSCFVL